MSEPLSRREFLQDSTAAAGGLVLTSLVLREGQAAPAEGGFASDWQNCLDRPWLGADYWAQPLQDWRISSGRAECIKAAPGRSVHLLTVELVEGETLKMSVRLGSVEHPQLKQGKGSAGFLIGVQGPLHEYRNNAVFGQGLSAGLTAAGKLFIGNPQQGTDIDTARDEVALVVQIDAAGKISLEALDAKGGSLGHVQAQVPAGSLKGNLALAANYGGAGGRGRNQPGALAGTGTFWFADWKVSGSRVAAHRDRAFGPVLFTQYTLSGNVLTLTAQMPPLGEQDADTVSLQFKTDGEWREAASAQIHPQARTATFRVNDWDATRDQNYRVVYSLRSRSGQETRGEWSGTIRRDPVDQPVLTVADVSCNIHDAFPNTLYTSKMAALNPDFIAFVGDQFYESTGGFGVQRAPLEPAILDYLRKWYMHGWTWRELTRDRPSISIPDDHDVYQGNIWGEEGAPQAGTQEMGGYNMPAPWVNVVHRTQTSHHPDPWDATPVKQDISVYSGPLVYGGISFAILADRQFKSAPEGNVPPTGSRGDHVVDPNFDPATADLPGLQLLGPRQLAFLRDWAADWQGAEMKAVISQTIFTSMATTHGSPDGRLVADYDTNGWPQSERNEALREIRKAFAFHLAGDQHLPAVVHYGIEEHGDAGVAFAGPAVNTGYPRWFEPLEPGKNRKPNDPEVLGEFRDSFHNPLTVLAVANPSKDPRKPVLERLHDKVSGLGLVRFNKPERSITIECWPLLADPAEQGTQFPGWPIQIGMLQNYGRAPAALLPRIEITGAEQPVITILDAAGERVYSLRLRENNWQPHVFKAGTYTVVVSHPESGREKKLEGLNAAPNNGQAIQVRL